MNLWGRRATYGAGLALLLAAGPGRAQDPDLAAISVTAPSPGSITNTGYVVIDASPTEKRVYGEGHHCLSVLTGDGIFALRPHPGDDIDGWGSTLYLQPFFSGATLRHSTNLTLAVLTNAGMPFIRLQVQGAVSRDTNSTYGTWTALLDLTFSNKTIRGTGTYAVVLAGWTNAFGDLSLYKLASNYLKTVPVVSGLTTNTGDMRWVIYEGDAFPVGWTRPLTWDPAVSAAHFPSDENTWLSVEVVGWTNDVDTARQGYAPIMPAHKPTTRVTLQSLNGTSLRFGSLFITGQGQWFWADNVGITPWVPAGSPHTNLQFALTFEAEAIPHDHYSYEVALGVTGLQRPYYGVYYAPDLTGAYARVGSLIWTNGGFEGKVKVGQPGFFQARRED